MSSIIDKFKRRNAPVEATSAAGQSGCYRNRFNYITLANATELATLVVSGVVDDTKGISGTIGGTKLTKSDISDLVVTRIMGAIESTRGIE